MSYTLIIAFLVAGFGFLNLLLFVFYLEVYEAVTGTALTWSGPLKRTLVPNLCLAMAAISILVLTGMGVHYLISLSGAL